MVYEKLDRLRAEVERLKAKLEDDKARLRAAEMKLKEAENSQILADVGALNLTPEQLAQFLQLAASGQLPIASQTDTPAKANTGYALQNKEDEESEEDFDEDEFN